MCRRMGVMDESVLSCCGPDYIHTSIFSCQVAMLDWMTCRSWHSAPFYRSVFEKTASSSFILFLLFSKHLPVNSEKNPIESVLFFPQNNVCLMCLWTKEDYTINKLQCFSLDKSWSTEAKKSDSGRTLRQELVLKQVNRFSFSDGFVCLSVYLYLSLCLSVLPLSLSVHGSLSFLFTKQIFQGEARIEYARSFVLHN